MLDDLPKVLLLSRNFGGIPNAVVAVVALFNVGSADRYGPQWLLLVSSTHKDYLTEWLLSQEVIK